jgi:hypothetical protein
MTAAVPKTSTPTSTEEYFESFADHSLIIGDHDTDRVGHRVTREFDSKIPRGWPGGKGAAEEFTFCHPGGPRTGPVARGGRSLLSSKSSTVKRHPS